ncbi:MAG: TonB-dependent receptor [Rhodothermia bacterium]|nr:MAG: TonB-dependent receptor [Rhodothermia bacterium]
MNFRHGFYFISRTASLLVLLLASAILFIGSVSAQDGTITGTVTEADSQSPLPGANIGVVGTLIGTTSGTDGSYSLSVPSGAVRIRVSFIGFATVEQDVTVASGETVRVNFSLAVSVAEFGEDLIVLGSRTQRTAVDTPVPVDVIPASVLERQGVTELNQALTMLAPSFNASHQTISDGTDHINPASLRGLGPDQVLVLLNGKRRHTSALVNVNGTFGRGTVGVDLNAIPMSAVERIEVLRDGAAALYGSDAIAGVINIVLKEQTEDILVNIGTGVTGESDGEQTQISANYGFRIGDGGFFNVTGEYMDRNRTDRSAPWEGDIFPGISGESGTNAELSRRGLTRRDFSMKTGQGFANTGAVFFNMAVPLRGTAEFYASGGTSHRKGAATGFYRLPNSEARVNLNVYPNGFLPEIHSEISDYSLTAGIQGTLNDWIVDLSTTTGGNSFVFNIENTINASIGEASPVSFDAGTISFDQTTGNLDLIRSIDAGDSFKSVALALGAEFRVENYQIEAGQFESYSLGNGGDIPGVDFDTTAAGGPKNPGSQVFAGFQPSNEVDRYRYSYSVYADLETEVDDQLMVDVAGRYEAYGDFGETLNGKIAARYEFKDNFAVRGAVSSGFRAPSLHQIWFNNVSIQFVLNDANELVPARVLSANNLDPVTKAFGVPNLKEETSINVSAGFTARPIPKLSISADLYMVNIDDRIVLSSRFTNSDPTAADILAPFARLGVSQAQFFANAVNTETKGVDIVAAYTTDAGPGTVTVTGAANFTKTEVTATNIPQKMADIFSGGDVEGVRTTLFNREERNRLETALPREKGNVSVRYSQGPISVLVRANYFGSIEYRPTNMNNDETFSEKVLLDLNVSYDVYPGATLTVGGNNILNTFPDKHQLAANRSNGRFIYSRRVTQFGMNGGFYYAKLSLKL